MEGEGRAPRGTGGRRGTLAAWDPPGRFAASQSSARPRPPHSPRLTSRSLSRLRLHHQPGRRSRHRPNHFSAPPPQPRPKASAESAASHARDVTSGRGSTAFRARLLPDWLVPTRYLREWAGLGRVR